MTSNSGLPRFRLMMSDGQHALSSFLLTTQLNHLPEQKLLVQHCICMLKKVVTSTLADGRTAVTVMDMEVVQSAEETGGRIGNPTPYNKDGQMSSPAKKSSATLEPDSSSATAPGPSYRSTSFSRSNAAQSSPTNSPMKVSPMKDTNSPMKFSPAKGTNSPMKFSPAKGSNSPMKASSSSPMKVFPISTLNPYQSKWTIRARVTNKSNVRQWSNSRGEGKLFSFEVVDESVSKETFFFCFMSAYCVTHGCFCFLHTMKYAGQQGEIKITAFNNEVDKFFSLLEQGKVYYISKATLKVANKQYSTLKNDYEMTLHAHSSIVPCEDNQSIPAMNCNFVQIEELENRDKDAIIDVIGICKKAEDVSRITTKNSREVSKRALHLIDSSCKEVIATLWGEEAEKFDGSGQPVVAIKGARLSDFGGRSLSALFSSTIMVNPDIPEAFRLRAWYDREGYAVNSQSLTERRSTNSGSRMNWKTLSDVKNENMGHEEKAEYFSCLATVVYMRKENCVYQACPSADCNKKVIIQHNGLYRCEKCNREFSDFKYRFLLSANLADFGDNQWVTCFQETAEVLLGHSAQTLGQLRETDEAAFDEVFQKANFRTHIFKNRVKLETYNDESRVKVTVMEVLPVDHREYSRRLLSNIRRLAC
uniref:Replication protein A subunit n=1 Tax=Oryzias latipes TaxID=8090 RepID=A0A3P9IHH7_ORYLA